MLSDLPIEIIVNEVLPHLSFSSLLRLLMVNKAEQRRLLASIQWTKFFDRMNWSEKIDALDRWSWSNIALESFSDIAERINDSEYKLIFASGEETRIDDAKKAFPRARLYANLQFNGRNDLATRLKEDMEWQRWRQTRSLLYIKASAFDYLNRVVLQLASGMGLEDILNSKKRRIEFGNIFMQFVDLSYSQWGYSLGTGEKILSKLFIESLSRGQLEKLCRYRSRSRVIKQLQFIIAKTIVMRGLYKHFCLSALYCNLPYVRKLRIKASIPLNVLLKRQLTIEDVDEMLEPIRGVNNASPIPDPQTASTMTLEEIHTQYRTKNRIIISYERWLETTFEWLR